MESLVSDTSVLIDLEHGALLEDCFRLPYRFVVPDILFAAELQDQDGGALIELGLTVEELDEAGTQLAAGYRGRSPALSVPDSFALALAKTKAWTLLAGDRKLRELADAEYVDCHGVLWVLDRMFEQQVSDGKRLAEGLTAIASNPRCRLPQAEILNRLQCYAVV